MFETGELKRHFRKALRTYLARRDHIARLLTSELADEVTFTKPDGGLALWATFQPDIDLPRLAEQAASLGLSLSSGLPHVAPGQQPHSIRMGFASSTEAELAQAVAILKQLTAGVTNKASRR